MSKFKSTMIAMGFIAMQITSTALHAQRVPFPSTSGVIEGDSATIGALIAGSMGSTSPGPVATASRNTSSTTWTSPSLVNVPTGTQCGAATQGSGRRDPYWTGCQGYNPKYSCPSGFYQAITGEADSVYFYTCVKS